MLSESGSAGDVRANTEEVFQLITTANVITSLMFDIIKVTG